MNLVAFAFRDTISEIVLEKLDLTDKFYISSNNEKIEKFVKKLVSQDYTYILGLGMYARTDRDKLRIETHYSKNQHKYPINYFITPDFKTKLAQGLGNSYCNFVSMKIMEAINSGEMRSIYTFIHIPKSFDIDVATNEIQRMLLKIDRLPR